MGFWERKPYRRLIMENILLALGALCNHCKKTGRILETAENIVTQELLENGLANQYRSAETEWETTWSARIKKLWTDKKIQEAFQEKHKIQFPGESLPYFMANLERVEHPQYTATDADIVRVKVKTTGIIDAEYEFAGQELTLTDTGGQRNERRSMLIVIRFLTPL